MSHSVLLTTTGTLSPVVINDLGGRAFTHPITDLNIGLEFTLIEISESEDLQAALDAGHITLKDALGNAISDVGDVFVGGSALFDFALQCGRSWFSATNIWLRSSDGGSLNNSPWVMPFDCDLVAISCTTNGNETWGVEIYKNGNIITPPVVGNAEHILNIVNQSSKREVLSTPVQLNDQDKVAVFCRGSNISDPSCLLFFRQRLP